jgi:hypothetical protein
MYILFDIHKIRYYLKTAIIVKRKIELAASFSGYYRNARFFPPRRAGDSASQWDNCFAVIVGFLSSQD